MTDETPPDGRPPPLPVGTPTAAAGPGAPGSPASPDPDVSAVRSEMAVAVTIVAVIALGALLRFRDIRRSEPFRCDEGFYLLEARRMVAQVEACRRILEIHRRDRPAGLVRLDGPERQRIEALVSRGYGQLGGRFLHDVFLAVGIGWTGSSDWVGQWIGALSGSVTVALVVMWAAGLWGARAGALAGALLATSTLHVAFSRSALCEADSVLMMMMCIHFHGRSLASRGRSDVWLFASGLLFGLAFLANIRAMPVVYAVGLCDAITQPWRAWPRRLAVFLAGALVGPVVAETAYHVLFLFSGAAGVLLTRQTYLMNFAWLLVRFRGGVVGGGGFSGHYWTYLTHLEGPLFLLAAVAGLGFLLAALRPGIDRRVEVVPVAVSLLVLTVYWELAVGLKFLRYLVPLSPLLALAGGRALAQVDGWARMRLGDTRAAPWVTPALALLVLVAGALKAWPLLPRDEAYRAAAAHLRTRGAHRLVATQPNIMRLHFPEEDVGIADDLDQIRALHARGHRFYVECYQMFHHPRRDALLAASRFLDQRARPVEIPHPSGASPFTWYEAGHLTRPADWDRVAGRIRIFDLDEVFGRPGGAPPVR